MLAIAGAAVVATGCRPVRDAPIPPGSAWSVLFERGSRSPFEDQTIPPTAPVERWRTRVGNGLTTAPILLEDVLVVTTTNRFVTTVSLETGEVFWERRKKGPFSAPPVADETAIYAVTHDVEGRAYALRRRDGAERWETRVPGTPVSATVLGEHLVISGGDGTLIALLRSDGETSWTRRLGSRLTSTPVPWEGDILVASGRDTLNSVDAATGSVGARLALGAPVSGQPALTDELLFVGLESGELVAIEPGALTERWRVRVDAPLLASPVVSSSGSIYLLARDGSVWVVRPGESQARSLANLGGAATRSLTLVGETLLVGLLDGRLVAVDAASGDEIWSARLGDSIHDPAVVAGATIVVPLRRGVLVGLGS